MIHSLPVLAAPLLDEDARLLALTDADVLGPVPPPELQSLVTLAAELIGGTAFLTLIDKDTLHAGIGSAGPVAALPRCDTVCNHVIRQDRAQVLVVEDLLASPDFASCAIAKMGLRFYAGVPVHAPDRQGRPQPLGALCIVAAEPGALDIAKRASLLRLASVADALLAARAAAKRATDAARHHEAVAADLARRNQVLAQAERLTRIGSWRLSMPDGTLHWSTGVWLIYGLPPGDAPALEQALAPYALDARRRIETCLAHTAETGEPFDFEEDFRDAAGTLRRVRCMGEREHLDGGSIGLVGVFQDLTDQRRVEAMLRHDAATDPLTGLPNRQGFGQALEAAIARARAGGSLTLAMIDLDGFKAINDRHGHGAGDQVLQAIGARLLADAPAGTLAARLGGDEFAVIVEDADLCAHPDALVRRLSAALRVPVEAAPGLLAGGSVGWAAFRPDCAGPQALMRQADASLYAVKRRAVADWQRGGATAGDRRRAPADRACHSGL